MPSYSVASLELIPAIPVWEDCVDSCGVVSVVSGFLFASSDTENVS